MRIEDIPAIPGLLRPFTGDLGVLEGIRTTLLRAASQAQTADSARVVYGWAIRGELRPLFYGAVAPAEPMTGSDALPRFTAAETVLPPLRFVLTTIPKSGVSRDMNPLLEDAITSDQPQRRLEGWCALICLCALNRGD